MANEISRALQLLTPKKNTAFFYSFLEESQPEYFDDSSGFDLTARLKLSNSTDYLRTGSINTKEIDQFRQGVELTSYGQFFSGISRGVCKIHAGEPGHVVKKNSYGYDRNFRKEKYYHDIEYFDPVDYLLSERVFTFPIITGDNDETENYNFNGVIEPFAIRSVASFFSIDVPFEAHDVRVNLEDGNSDITRATSRIVNVYERNPAFRIAPWLDMIDMVGEVKKVPTMGFFNDDRTFVSPFNDQKKKVQSSSTLEGVMLDAVDSLQASTENYISKEYVSAPCGWMYDDVAQAGTDSIAFGGFGH